MESVWEDKADSYISNRFPHKDRGKVIHHIRTKVIKKTVKTKEIAKWQKRFETDLELSELKESIKGIKI